MAHSDTLRAQTITYYALRDKLMKQEEARLSFEALAKNPIVKTMVDRSMAEEKARFAAFAKEFRKGNKTFDKYGEYWWGSD